MKGNGIGLESIVQNPDNEKIGFNGTVEEIRNINELDSFSEEWKRVQNLSKIEHPFLDWNWVRIWADRMVFEGNTLLFIVVRDRDGSAVGIAPFQLKKTKFLLSIEAFAQEFCDYVDWLCVPGFDRQVEEEVFGWLKKIIEQNECDFVRIYNIFPGGVAYNAFYRFGVGFFHKHSIAPQITIEGTYDNYLKSLKRKFVSDLGRRKRKLIREVGEVHYFVLRNKSEISLFVDLIIKWFSSRMKVKHESSYLERDGMKQHIVRLYEALYDAKMLHLTGIKVKEKVIALNVAFKYKKSIYSYTPVFDMDYSKYAVIRLLKLHDIEECFQNGVNIYDFCLGGEGYKFNYQPTVKQLFKFEKNTTTNKGRIKYLIDSYMKKYIKRGYLVRLKFPSF